MNILIIHPHAVLRAGLSKVFHKAAQVEKVHESEVMVQAGVYFRQKKIGMLMIDTESRPDFDSIKNVKAQFPALYIVGICSTGNSRMITSSYEAGVNSLISNEASSEDVRMILQHAVEAKNYFYHGFTEALLKYFISSDTRKRSKEVSLISRREEEVLKLICEQMDNKKIAQKLFISDLTVRRHRQNLLQKTRSSNTAGLVIFAIKHGIYRVYEGSMT